MEKSPQTPFFVPNSLNGNNGQNTVATKKEINENNSKNIGPIKMACIAGMKQGFIKSHVSKVLSDIYL